MGTLWRYVGRWMCRRLGKGAGVSALFFRQPEQPLRSRSVQPNDDRLERLGRPLLVLTSSHRDHRRRLLARGCHRSRVYRGQSGLHQPVPFVSGVGQAGPFPRRCGRPRIRRGGDCSPSPIVPHPPPFLLSAGARVSCCAGRRGPCTRFSLKYTIEAFAAIQGSRMRPGARGSTPTLDYFKNKCTTVERAAKRHGHVLYSPAIAAWQGKRAP